MDARKCDCCGKFYEYFNGMERFSKSGQSNTVELLDKRLNGSCVERCTIFARSAWKNA